MTSSTLCPLDRGRPNTDIVDWRELIARAGPGREPAPREAGMPEWAAVLKESLDLSPVVRAEDDERDRDECAATPFAPLYEPFVRVAAGRLASRCPSGWARLAPSARLDLESGLRRRLGHLCGQALELEFSLFRVAGESSLACLFDEFHDGGPPTRRYDAFLAEMTGGGLARFFAEYCVLGRLVGSAILLFVDAFSELLDHLERDRGRIRSVFGSGRPDLGPVVRIRPYLSDTHRGGRAVTHVSFGSGVSVLHKPKDLGMDHAFGELLEWLNERTGLPPLKAPRMLARRTYGWVEFVQARPWRDTAEASRYFREAGMLLCVAYVLSANDLHYENIVRAGEHPVLVDLETLLTPRLRNRTGDEPHAGGFDPGLDRSVLGTGLLPVHDTGPDGAVHDSSGLGWTPGESAGFWTPQWSRINTDHMSLDFARRPGRGPAADGGNVPLVRHENDLIDGFRSMYAQLRRLQGELLAARGPVAAIARRRVRVILRQTRLYELVLHRSLRPECLRDGAARKAELDVLAVHAPTDADPASLGALSACETTALERMDIPVFFARADGTDLFGEDGTKVRRALVRPGHLAAVDRLLALGDGDLARQIAFIRGSVGAKAAAARGTSYLSSGAGRPAVPSAADLVSAAQAIGDGLRARAIVAVDGATWTAPYLGRDRTITPRLMGYGLFDGTCGVALFLAALGRQTGRSGYADLARLAMRPLRTALQRGTFSATAARMGPGGAVGLPGLILALTHVGEFLDDPGPLDAADRVAALLTADRLRAIQESDVVAGAAGTLLSLLALHARTGAPPLLAKATVCGDLLLRRRTAAPTGAPAWADPQGRHLTGFSHGAAGIGYALLRLYAATGREELRRAALEGIAHETALFDPACGNWPDLRLPDGGAPAFGSSWCQGAPGIGLARLACADLAGDAASGRDVEPAVTATLAASAERSDQLCCGAMGRTELLLSTARRRNRPELERAARTIAGEVLDRAERSGSFDFGVKGAVDNPGLFQGAAGIGYQLLRLAEPERLPALLLWE
ncbi:type 2 lantipeptide synthetase LanM [Actinomadura sp. KC345]|uniref:type 2 lanthipeptide synthetase LanM family protein n=1 Tax=Actinomadura sp. KC345 TaxID=2530371 RepID=UPI001050E002|nr:type 2 lanthipeptide synthetase LanM family protein [Actinomadura sp. KC345]TDC52494.1 type 2 lantipeptide synthetase LanM [Actinomadura sp. KC345]